jgi:hypothetical protein
MYHSTTQPALLTLGHKRPLKHNRDEAALIDCNRQKQIITSSEYIGSVALVDIAPATYGATKQLL